MLSKEPSANSREMFTQETKKHKETVKEIGRISYDEATTVIKDFKSRVRFCFNNKQRTRGSKCIRLKIIAAGSYRRKKETLKDIDLIIIYPKKYASHKDYILESMILNDSKSAQIKSMLPNPKMQGTMHSQYKVVLYNHPKIDFRLDLFLIPEESLPFALFHYTGSKQFNIRTRAYVKKIGLLLNQYGLYDIGSGKKINTKIKTERDLFRYLDITYKSPKQRSE